LQARFEAEKKQAEIELLKKDKQIQEVEIYNQKLLLLSLVGGFSTVLIISILFWWRSRERGKANSLLNKQKEEITQQAAKLSELNQLKNTILSIVSHDLRSPLGALKNTIDFLDFSDISPDEWENIKAEASRQLSGLDFTLNNLLLWAKSQMQGESTQKQSIDLQEIVEDKTTLFQPLAQQKKIQLLNSIPKGVKAYADTNQVRVIFRNLIANAIKFTEEKGIITISAYPENGQVIVNVKDTGKGMNQEQIERLFDSPKPMVTRGTAGEKGTGLGLILIKDFLQKNNGKIWVESEIGKGSTFYFSLPSK
jgi:signal transduction histidine kinase